MRYLAKFTAAEEGGYVVTFPDFPDAITEGDSMSDALLRARRSLREVIAARLAHGEAIPEPVSENAGMVLVEPDEETRGRIEAFFATKEA